MAQSNVKGLTFRVGTADYTVTEMEGLQKHYDLYGQVTYDNATIVVEPTLCTQRKHNVIIHELIHAMLFEAGYDEQDEEQVRRLGNVLTQVLRDNVEVFAEMFENEIEEEFE
jgi:Zn-dependent peptidase ImmA (M78 family)